MSPTDDAAEGADFVDRARTDPASVDLAEVAERAEGDDDARTTAAKAVSELAASAPDRCDEAVPTLVGLLDDSDATVRSAATVAADRLVRTRPETAPDLVPGLITCLDDDEPSVRHNALTALSNVQPSASASLAPAIPALSPFLESEYASVRDATLSVLLAAVEAPADRETPDEAALDAAARLVPRLLGLLVEPREEDSVAGARGAVIGDDTREALAQGATEVRLQSEEARAKTTRVLGALATQSPDAVARAVPELRTAATDAGSEAERAAILDVLARLGASRPDAVRPAVGDLVAALRDAETAPLGGTAARALSNVAEADPEAVTEEVAPVSDAVVDLLDADPAHARASAATLVSYVAEYDPDAVASATDPLIARLDDDEPAVRGSAALALGALRADAAVPALRDLESADSDPRVRDAAASALETVESGQH